MSADLAWHKSSYSNDTGGNCVETMETSERAFIRDTQNRERGYLGFASSEWSAFVTGLKRGEFGV